MSNCGLDDSANSLMDALTADVDIKIPDINLSDPIYAFPGDQYSALYKEVKPLTNEDLTSREVDGAGTFDSLMAGVSAHLADQFDKGRITSDDYAKVYIALTEAAMGNAVQFLLNRDANFWAAQAAQLNAITARVLLETEKTKLATFHLEALRTKTLYAMAKSELAISGVEHCSAEYRYQNILPKENAALQKQNDGLDLDNRTKNFNLNSILNAQHQGLELDNQAKDYNVKNVLPVDYRTKVFQLTELMPAQKQLIGEQYEVQRAQTLDTRSDNQVVTGTLGKQKALYSQQIDSYQRNAELNAAKIFSDSWITQKTLDEGLLPPSSLNNQSVDEVLTAIKYLNGLGTAP